MMQSKYSNFQVENSNNIISSILYNQFLSDSDSCSDIVGYFYDVAPRWIYTGKTISTTNLSTRLKAI